MAQERIRVVVGDPAPLNRALARHFLEEDGFEVVGDAARSADVLELVQRTHPDAVVLDEELAGTGPLDVITPLRSSSPDTKIVVLTGQPERSGSRGVDATLEKGVGLSNLSPVLRRLCGMGVVAGRGQVPPARLRQGSSLEALRAAVQTERSDRRLMVRIGAVAATLAVLSALALALISEPGRRIGPTPTPSSPPTSPTPEVVVNNDGAQYLDDALAAYRGLADALRSGDFGEAARFARLVMASRAAALAAGTDVSSLNAMIASGLAPLLEGSDLRTLFTLEGIFGALLPPIEPPEEEEPPPPDDGGTIVLSEGPTRESGGDGGGREGGDRHRDGDGHQDGDGGNGGGGNGGGDDGGGDDHPGNHFGWSHKPPHGGWHHGWDIGKGNPKRRL